MVARPAVLVTGGAGYVGSHIVHAFLDAGWRVTVVDDLSTGHAWAVGEARLVVLDLTQPAGLFELLREGRFDALVHCAAKVVVEESVREPATYYRHNAAASFHLFELCARAGIGCLVQSSTAAVYGQPERNPIAEDAPLAPINPYGASKAMAERALVDIATASGLRYGMLRYFNVAGADPAGRVGQATPRATHLVKVACETALGLRPELAIFGTDYPTPDGTCIRDYIHVSDLAAAHLRAVEYLLDGGPSFVANCGYGHGASVREVIATVKAVTGIDFPVREAPRRPGDAAALVADNRRIRALLGWQPRYDDLAFIVETAWRWENHLQSLVGARGGR
ncbi:UDP-glucose 4-epimerase [bacterium HR40]|nr:UDP-glucose 4-epimerase [bacterium HR40]